jgi:phosphoribosylpyrophosphate synthetase
MEDTNNTYNVPAEGFGYYLNDEEKEEAAQKSWEQYALDKQNQRFIRKITALVSSVLLAQEKGYLNYNDGNKNNEENGREGQATNQQDNARQTSNSQSLHEGKDSRGNEALLVNDTKGIDYTSELLRRAREFCHGKNVDGIALYTGMKYVPEDREPKRKDGEISEDTINRELILAFKAGEDYDLKTVTNVREIMSGWLSKSVIDCFKEYTTASLVLVPCACHSKDASQVRWWRFLEMTTARCAEMLHPIENGFSSIQFIQDSPIPSHYNKSKAPQAQYKYKNLKGKNVVLVDDICASRNTLRRNIKMIQKAGGHVVACFVFADSNPE